MGDNQTSDIFLVRHGEAAASWGESPDPGLSELGQREAEAAAEYLRQRITQDTVLLTSPLLRAIETATPLARSLKLSVQVDETFREVPSPVPLEQRQDWLRQFMQQQWSEQGEDLGAWRETAIQQLLNLKTPAVVYTHFLLINAVVGKLLDRPQTVCFSPANGSITQLRHNGSGLELIVLGQEIQSFVN